MLLKACYNSPSPPTFSVFSFVCVYVFAEFAKPPISIPRRPQLCTDSDKQLITGLMARDYFLIAMLESIWPDRPCCNRRLVTATMDSGAYSGVRVGNTKYVKSRGGKKSAADTVKIKRCYVNLTGSNKFCGAAKTKIF